MHKIELTGLDGGNLLAFMAALGTLRVLTIAEPDAGVRMSWVETRWWMPVIHHPRIGTGEELVAVLEKKVCGESSISPAWEIGDDLNLALADFHGHLEKCAGSSALGQRAVADFLAAFGSDSVGAGPKKELMSDSEFRTMSGAGHQHFLGFMRELAVSCATDDLTRTLLEDWDYGDGRPSLRWDAADYRPHALRAEDPSGDPIKTMRGANRLAIEALPLFPTVPERRRLRTVGFQDREKTTGVTWPIWTGQLTLDAVASVLASEEIQAADLSLARKRGIAQVFRARRFTEGKYRNFSPARALL